MTRLLESQAVAQLQRLKSSYQSLIKVNYETRAEDCGTCDTRGQCCTDEHFVNVQITRLEAVAIRETIERTPRLTYSEKRGVYTRAREAVIRYRLNSAGDTFSKTYSCPLFLPELGCIVHRRAKPAPCIQHSCYENWEDLPPLSLQTRVENRVEKLNNEVYGLAWGWLPTPYWITLVDPLSDSRELELIASEWRSGSRRREGVNRAEILNARQLPVFNSRALR